MTPSCLPSDGASTKPSANQFRRLWVGQTISLFGDQVTLLALPLVAVLLLDVSAAQMGYLSAAVLLPNLLVPLHAGAWVDRHGRRRRLMITADLGRAALLATVPLAWALGALSLAQLYAVGFLTGTFSMLFMVCHNTVFVAVTPRDRFVEGNTLINGSRAFSFVGGKSLAGLLVQVLSAPGALLADAASFLASALCLGRISAAEPPPDAEGRGRGNLGAGARWILRSPIVRASLAADTVENFFNYVFLALFILYASRTLRIPAGTLGLVLGSGSVGGVLGSLLTGRLIRRLGVGPAYVLGFVVSTAPLLLVPLAGGARPVVLGLLFCSWFGAGFGIMVVDIANGAILAAAIPDRLRARVWGAYLLVNYGVRPLGALVGGLLGSAIGLRPTLWIAAAGGMTSVLCLLPSPIPRLKALPEADTGTGREGSGGDGRMGAGTRAAR
jgi:MFS family permease